MYTPTVLSSAIQYIDPLKTICLPETMSAHLVPILNLNQNDYLHDYENFFFKLRISSSKFWFHFLCIFSALAWIKNSYMAMESDRNFNPGGVTINKFSLAVHFTISKSK